jgi:fatty acid desaturase
MRYVIAMIFAIIGAALMMRFASSDIATLVVASRRFESPDDVADMHTAIFMLMNVVGLVAGWILGWIFGGVLVGPTQRPE